MYSLVISIVHCLLITLLHIIKVYRFDKPAEDLLVLGDQVLFARWPRSYMSYHSFCFLGCYVVSYYITLLMLPRILPSPSSGCVSEAAGSSETSVHLYNITLHDILETALFIHSLVFSLRGRAGRNQSPVM